MPLTRFVGLIARLKWLLTLRHFQRNKAGAVATGIALTVVTLILVSGLGMLAVYLHVSGSGQRDTFMLWALWIASALWITAPLAQFDAQRNIDLTGLRLLPLPRSWFTLAVLLDGAVSPLGVITLPVGLVLCAAFTLHWRELPLVLLSLLLLGVFQLGCAQALYLFGNRILSSRRYSEISMGCGFILFMAIQMMNIALQTGGMHLPPWALETVHAVRAAVYPLAAWLAPGVAARAVAAGSAGRLLDAAGLYLLLAAQAGAALVLTGFAARVFYESELESGGQARPAKAPQARSAPGSSLVAAGQRWGLSPLLLALFRREQTYLWRDPAVRLPFMQSLFGTLYLAFVAVMLNFHHGNLAELVRVQSYGKYALLFIALLLGFSESAVLFNRFGYEGGQLATLLLTPVSRRTVLAGKSLFLVSHFVGLNLLLCAGIGIALHAPPLYIMLALLLVLSNTLLLDAVGYYVSIFYPFAYRRVGQRLRAVMPQPGCGYVVAYMLVFQLSNLAAFPISVVSALLVIFLGWPGLLLAAVWSAAACWTAYHFALPHASAQLQRREPQLLAALAKGTE
jgi:hypothetical protein